MNARKRAAHLCSRRSLFATLSALAILVTAGCNTQKPASETVEERIVSLSPALTETIITLDKGDLLVGISDYCSWRGNRPAPPRLGSAITPGLEKIAGVTPTRILATEVRGDQLTPLNKLAPTTSLPWLTTKEFVSSIDELGKVVGAEKKAKKLSNKIRSKLDLPAKKGAPRVLLALDYGDSGSSETWFIKRNSIHGSVLHAAGARNAVDQDVPGQPRLTPEALIKINPDAVIVLRSAEPDAEKEKASLAPYRKLKPLKATQDGKLAVLSIPGALSVGPSILELVDDLKEEVDALFPAETAPPADEAE